jgi:hypothetical protein
MPQPGVKPPRLAASAEPLPSGAALVEASPTVAGRNDPPLRSVTWFASVGIRLACAYELGPGTAPRLSGTSFAWWVWRSSVGHLPPRKPRNSLKLDGFPVAVVVVAVPGIDFSAAHVASEAADDTDKPVRAPCLARLIASGALGTTKHDRDGGAHDHWFTMRSKP